MIRSSEFGGGLGIFGLEDAVEFVLLALAIGVVFPVDAHSGFRFDDLLGSKDRRKSLWVWGLGGLGSCFNTTSCQPSTINHQSLIEKTNAGSERDRWALACMDS